jgi:hypothetical protein
MFNLAITSLLLSASNTFGAVPNTTECHQCISDVNNLKSHNSSIFNLLNNLDNFCTQFNFTQCLNFTNQTEQALDNLNSTSVCEELGYCDSLNLDNFVMNINDVYVFTYYNSILGMESKLSLKNKSLSPEMDFHQTWNLTFQEPIVDINQYILDNYPHLDCGIPPESCPIHMPCSIYGCIFNTINMLKITTDSHIYYFNITNSSRPSFLGRVHYVSESSYLDWFSNFKDLWYSKKSMYSKDALPINDYRGVYKFYNRNNMSMIDSLYNGTVYSVIANWSTNFHTFDNLRLVNWDFNF